MFDETDEDRKVGSSARFTITIDFDREVIELKAVKKTGMKPKAKNNTVEF